MRRSVPRKELPEMIGTSSPRPVGLNYFFAAKERRGCRGAVVFVRDRRQCVDVQIPMHSAGHGDVSPALSRRRRVWVWDSRYAVATICVRSTSARVDSRMIVSTGFGGSLSSCESSSRCDALGRDSSFSDTMPPPSVEIGAAPVGGEPDSIGKVVFPVDGSAGCYPSAFPVDSVVQQQK